MKNIRWCGMGMLLGICVLLLGTPEESGATSVQRKSYEVSGKRYYIQNAAVGQREEGLASWYGATFHGRPTASGEPFDAGAITAAHKTLPLGTIVRVKNLSNGRSLRVRINDRGPFRQGRIIDLSHAAAKQLGFSQKGTTRVDVVVETVVPLSKRAVASAAVTKVRVVDVESDIFTEPATQSLLQKAEPSVVAGREDLPPVVAEELLRQQAIAQYMSAQTEAVPQRVSGNTNLTKVGAQKPSKSGAAASVNRPQAGAQQSATTSKSRRRGLLLSDAIGLRAEAGIAQHMTSVPAPSPEQITLSQEERLTPVQYAVLVKNFAKRDAAARLALQLQREGYRAFSLQKQPEFWSVLLGPWDALERAENFAGRLKKKYPDVRVVED